MAPTNKNWRDDAACRGMDTEIFFPGPTDIDRVNTAHRACDRCPVKADCLEFAFKVHAQHGIWGGTSAYTRNRVDEPRKPRKIRPPITEAEQEQIKKLSALGMSNSEIARALDISYRTVSRYRSRLDEVAA